MGWASEMYIEDFNARYESDEDFRNAYDEQMQIDAAEEAAYFEREKELEKFEQFFADKLIDVCGEAIELPEPAPLELIDDDIPF